MSDKIVVSSVVSGVPILPSLFPFPYINVEHPVATMNQ